MAHAETWTEMMNDIVTALKTWQKLNSAIDAGQTAYRCDDAETDK
jgi:hypothetical protein